MKKHFLAGLLTCLLSGPANALIIDISETGFVDLNRSQLLVPPEETVIGSFEYIRDSSNFFTLLSFNMTISNKDYVLADAIVEQSSPFGMDSVLIGGNGIASSIGSNGTNDFFLSFNYSTNTITEFAYEVAEDAGFWKRPSSNPALIPEPTILTLIALGLTGISFSRKKEGSLSAAVFIALQKVVGLSLAEDSRSVEF